MPAFPDWMSSSDGLSAEAYKALAEKIRRRLAPLMLFTVTLLAVRNQRILAAWDARQEENARRAARGLPPRTRKRRRRTPAALTATAPP